MVLLHGIDKAEHVFWDTVEPIPGGPINTVQLDLEASGWTGPVPDDPNETSTLLMIGSNASQYLEADDWLARVVGRFDYVVMVSDHGMGRNPAPGLSGQHGSNIPNARPAIIAISGPSVKTGFNLGAVSIFDVAPTVAWLVDAPVSDELPGRVLSEAFEPRFLAQHPIQSIPSWEPTPPIRVPTLGVRGLGLLIALFVLLTASTLRGWRNSGEFAGSGGA